MEVLRLAIVKLLWYFELKTGDCLLIARKIFMFEEIETVAFDLGDTLITVNAGPEQLEAVWQEIYTELHHTEGENLPPLSAIRRCIEEHVGRKMQATWREKIEAELDIMEMFTNALHAAQVPRAHEAAFVRHIIELEHVLLGKYVRVGPQVFDTLTELKRRGYKLGLVSNFCNIPEVVYGSIEQLGLRPFFDATIISCEIGWRKPSPRIYAETVRRLQTRPENILFVGDRLVEDVRGPHIAGMKAALTHESRQEDPAETGIVPDLLIRNVADLLEHLPPHAKRAKTAL